MTMFLKVEHETTWPIFILKLQILETHQWTQPYHCNSMAVLWRQRNCCCYYYVVPSSLRVAVLAGTHPFTVAGPTISKSAPPHVHDYYLLFNWEHNFWTSSILKTYPIHSVYDSYCLLLPGFKVHF